MATRPTRLHKLYASYNRRFFAGKLPKDAQIRWSNKPLPCDAVGMCSYDRGDGLAEILVSSKLRRWTAFAYSTLLHEMAHLSLFVGGYTRGDHGRKFQREMRRLARVGAFRKLW